MPTTWSDRSARRRAGKALASLCAAASLAALPLAAQPARAGAARPAELSAARPNAAGYHPVRLDETGRPAPGELERLVAALRPEVDGRTHLLLLVHGFATPMEKGAADYHTVAGRIRARAAALGLRVAVVGVHWASDAGPLPLWMTQAIGHRIVSLLGFRNAIRNPYLEKVALARRTGRLGLRPLLLRLEEAFPAARIHLLAHSLGAEVVVSALCAERDSRLGGPSPSSESRKLRVGLVALAGADLDEDAFSREAERSRCLALDRAEVWWVTVPPQGIADGVLELRRGAGRGDALGNKGPRLSSEELARLLERRALVLDDGPIPIGHELTDYYSESRLDELLRAMEYLRDAAAPAAGTSLLATLDRLLRGDAAALADAARERGPARLYARWRLGESEPAAAGALRHAGALPNSRVLGTRQERRR